MIMSIKHNKDDYDSMVHRYVDGELNKEEAKEFEELLASSPEMQSELESIRTVGDTLRDAMHAELEQVNFRPVWSAVNEEIEKDNEHRSKGIIYRLFASFTPPRVAAMAAATATLVLGAFIVWHFMLAPISGEAAHTEVTIEYGDDLDIEISVDTLDDSVTTVVWIHNFSVDEETDETYEE